MTAGDAVLRLDGLSAGHDGVDVVHDVDLEVAAGEVVALLGANGAGKTTTLLAVSGLVVPSAGSVEVFGARVPSPHRRWRRWSAAGVWQLARSGVAHVADDRGLFADLTVAENLRLGRAAGRRRDGVVPDEQLFEWFPQLAAIPDRRAGLLSGGEQQMLALARAVVSRPRLLMIDEMSAGLAPIVVQQLLEILRTVATETGVAMLVVEQYVELALGIADRGHLLRDGRVVLSGTAAELSQRRGEIEAGYLGG